MRFLTIILFSLSTTAMLSQDNVGFNFLFMTWHPGGNNMAFLQPNKLDSKAILVLNWGGVVHYERFIYRQRFSIKIAQGAYSDCANLFAGHTHVAFRINFFNGKKHALRFGFGPTFIYRQSWERFPGYKQENHYLKTHGNWQTAFIWYAGEIEYDYNINKAWSVNFHVIPGVPDFFNFGFGFRYWINAIPSNREWKSQPNRNKWFYKKDDVLFD